MTFFHLENTGNIGQFFLAKYVIFKQNIGNIGHYILKI